jgi:hypothetical protein
MPDKKGGRTHGLLVGSLLLLLLPSPQSLLCDCVGVSVAQRSTRNRHDWRRRIRALTFALVPAPAAILALYPATQVPAHPVM